LIPTYSGQPAGCLLNLNFQLTLLTKITDSAFINDARFNQPAIVMPSFIELDSAAGVFNLQGSEFFELWNTYTLQLTAVDSSVISNSSFTLKVHTALDCSQGLNFNPSLSFQHSVRYNIGSGIISYYYAPALDSISEYTGVSEVCGPVQYNITAIDSEGTWILLPSFIDFKSSNKLEIWTNEETFEGSYLLLFDIFLADFPASPHRQEIVEVVVANSSIYTIL
jgi:hypothetical protein